MADRQQPNSKRKTAPDGAEPGVLGGLPSTRPARMGRRNRDAAGSAARTRTAATTARSQPAGKATTAKAAKAKSRHAKAKAQTAPVKLETQPRRPRPVRAGHPGLGTSPAERGRAGRVEAQTPSTGVVTTAVQAAGELASIGLTLGGQLLKRAGEKLPRP